jgi:hypothetical protein
MATYDSSTTTEPGQYPAPAWSKFGLPVQNESSGAPGTSRVSSAEDSPSPGTNLPGQYPDRDDFTGVAFSLGGAAGTGAPGSAGVGAPDGGSGAAGGGDSVQFTVDPLQMKSQYDSDPSGQNSGMRQVTARVPVSGNSDWTQANPQSYDGDPSLFLPPLRGNMPTGGEDDRSMFQTGAGSVLYGGYLKGARDRDRNRD